MLSLCFLVQHVVKLPFCDVLYYYTQPQVLYYLFSVHKVMQTLTLFYFYFHFQLHHDCIHYFFKFQ